MHFTIDLCFFSEKHLTFHPLTGLRDMINQKNNRQNT